MRRVRSLVLCGLMSLLSLPGMAKEDLPVKVVLETTLGNIVMEVYTDKAPLSSAAFLSFIDDGTFDGNSAFYRAVRPGNESVSPGIEVIQGGILPLNRLRDLPGIQHETTRQTGLLHKDGTVSMARGDVGTANGATFFICIGDQPSLDYGGKRYADRQGFAAFGKVTKGMDIVRRIQKMETTHWPEHPDAPQQYLESPVRILKAYRAESYSPYAANRYPNNVYWGDTHLYRRTWPRQMDGGRL